MSTFWTPDGERPISGDQPQAADPQANREPAGFGEVPEGMTEEEAQLEMLRQQLLEAPADIVVANHCFGLFELAALHLSSQPVNQEGAQLAIDALGALVEALQGRLGDAEEQLVNGLSQLRLAYVQISQAANQPEAN